MAIKRTRSRERDVSNVPVPSYIADQGAFDFPLGLTRQKVPHVRIKDIMPGIQPVISFPVGYNPNTQRWDFTEVSAGGGASTVTAQMWGYDTGTTAWIKLEVDSAGRTTLDPLSEPFAKVKGDDQDAPGTFRNLLCDDYGHQFVRYMEGLNSTQVTVVNNGAIQTLLAEDRKTIWIKTQNISSSGVVQVGLTNSSSNLLIRLQVNEIVEWMYCTRRLYTFGAVGTETLVTRMSQA